MPILTWLKLLVLLSGPLIYGVQELRLKWQDRGAKLAQAYAVEQAVAQTKEEQRVFWTAQLEAQKKSIEEAFTRNAFNTVTVVKDAAEQTPPTPEKQADRQRLCDTDRMCRDRGRKK